MLSLPMFAIMPQSVRRGFVGLSRPKNSGGGSPYDGHNNPLLTSSLSSIIRKPYTMLALNLLSQLICVAGVNQLSSVRTFFFSFVPSLFQKYKNHRSPFTHSPHVHFTFPICQKTIWSLTDFIFFPIHLITSDRECPRCQHRSYSRLARQ